MAILDNIKIPTTMNGSLRDGSMSSQRSDKQFGERSLNSHGFEVLAKSVQPLTNQENQGARENNQISNMGIFQRPRASRVRAPKTASVKRRPQMPTYSHTDKSFRISFARDQKTICFENINSLKSMVTTQQAASGGNQLASLGIQLDKQSLDYLQNQRKEAQQTLDYPRERD